MTDQPDITLHCPAPDAGLTALHDRLAEAGQTLRAEDMPVFLLRVDGPDGVMQAGCKGELAFRSAHVSELWVHEDLRGQGIGAALLARAEAFAVERGCTRLHLETRNEGARRLYERLGYRVFGTLADYDGAQAFYYLEKPLG
jgi:ribosomal protein S18 acetylase RimI-like enzyme